MADRWYSRPLPDRATSAIISGALLVCALGAIVTSLVSPPPVLFVVTAAGVGTAAALLGRWMRGWIASTLQTTMVAVMATIAGDVFYGERAAGAVTQWQIGFLLVLAFLVPLVLTERRPARGSPAAEPAAPRRSA